jgi:hypothetical protein
MREIHLVTAGALVASEAVMGMTSSGLRQEGNHDER